MFHLKRTTGLFKAITFTRSININSFRLNSDTNKIDKNNDIDPSKVVEEIKIDQEPDLEKELQDKKDLFNKTKVY